jgi:hypothetical protein
LPNCNKASQIFRLSAAFMPSLREPLRVLSRLKSQLQNAHKLLIINVNILSGECDRMAKFAFGQHSAPVFILCIAQR